MTTIRSWIDFLNNSIRFGRKMCKPDEEREALVLLRLVGVRSLDQLVPVLPHAIDAPVQWMQLATYYQKRFKLHSSVLRLAFYRVGFSNGEHTDLAEQCGRVRADGLRS